MVLSGKYHILSALSEDTDDIVDPTSVDEDSKANVFSEAAILLEKLIKGSVSVEEVCKNTVLAEINTALQAQKQLLKSSRTAMLWLQYMEMVDILRKYIRAERTGNWDLHLQALLEMIPYLAASGHNNYTKSALIYLQRMSHLQEDHPEVYHHFQNGLHVIRRSDRYWAGLSTDLVIEQVLMRSMKTSGGLTRVRGMTEQQRIIWSLAMPACAEINRAMQELTGVMFNSGEQNKAITQARQARDWKDTQTVLLFLQKSNPFIADPSLRNICTGVHGQSSVNVETAKAIGTAILTSMEDKTVMEYTFKKTNQVVTLATKTRVIVDDASLQIDPLLLFQGLTIAARTSTEDNEKIFKYELCSYPPALFDSSLLLREPQKSVLANSIWNCLTQECPEIPEDVEFVLDGGSLLQRIPWQHGMTYREICIVYT